MMRYFKDQSDGYYVFTGEPQQGWIEITKAEYDAANPPPPLPPLQQRIDNLVRTQTQGQIENELMLEGLMAGLLGGAIATGTTEAQLESRNSAYRNGKLLRAAIAAMRAAG